MIAFHTPTVLTDDAMMQRAPSIFAGRPCHGMSDSYAFIPTIDVVNCLRDRGWMPVRVAETWTRIQQKVGYTKHMIRFRQTDAPILVDDIIPEIVLVNAHDGGAAFQMILGLFRLVCANGLMVGKSCFERISIRHSGDVHGAVMMSALRIAAEAPGIAPAIRVMQARQLTSSQRHAYATAALELKYGRSRKSGVLLSPVEPEQLLMPRRKEDEGNDLWTTFNVVQENLLKGGLAGRTHGLYSRVIRTRSVESVREDIRLNRGLWTIAREFDRNRPIIRKKTPDPPDCRKMKPS